MGFVDYKTEGMVGIVTINREKQLNALNLQVLDDLSEVLDQVDVGAIRCLIVTGAGDKSFVAGADIAQMKDLDKAAAKEFGKKGNDVMRKLEAFPIPTIAAINGFALGGGCELAMSCDMRICSETAVFAQPETSLGITPGFGGTQRLSRLIGDGMAKEIIYTCRKVKAPEALALGLVNHVYPVETLMEEAHKLANKIAANAPIAVRASKKAINDGMQVDIDSAVAIEQEMFSVCFETADQQNAMTAFVQKEKPSAFENK